MKKKKDSTDHKHKKVKAYQEINPDISKSKVLAQQKPVPQPQDFDEIEY